MLLSVLHVSDLEHDNITGPESQSEAATYTNEVPLVNTVSATSFSYAMHYRFSPYPVVCSTHTD